MKVKIKDLQPNPFRDIENYPINQGKVESLARSINQTGFWNNILARKSNGKIQIAYGHHRLVVLQRDCAPDFIVDIPVKDLDDATMIRIMANENMEQWELNPTIITETVKVTREFLFSHQEIVRRLDRSPQSETRSFDKSNAIGARVITRFLGPNWKLDWVSDALLRLRMVKKNELDKEAIDSMPSPRAAKDFVEAVKMSSASKQTQRKVAKKIVKSRTKEHTEEGSITGKYRMEAEMHEEEHGDEEKAREEKRKLDEKERRQQFEHHLSTLADKARSLLHSLVNLLEFRDVLLSDHYQKSREAQDFVYWIAESFSVFRLLMGQDKQGKQIPENIEATIKMCTEAEERADEKERSRKATESLKLLLAPKNKKEVK